MALLAFVEVDHLLRVDGQLLVRVDHHAEQARVRLHTSTCIRVRKHIICVWLLVLVAKGDADDADAEDEDRGAKSKAKQKKHQPLERT